MTEPGYPVPERGALFAGAESCGRCRYGRRPGSSPTWKRSLRRRSRGRPFFWLNYPNNPTGAVAPLSFYEEHAGAAEGHDFVLASDEAYSELWFAQPPVSALQVAERSSVIVFQTLSKRSSMTGYRSGFVAGPPEVIAALRAYRPTVGTAPQEFVQRASSSAWGDEYHVEATRARYRVKRDVLLGAWKRGWEVVASDATMYLWVGGAGPRRLLGLGVVVSPGALLGPTGEGYVRFALVPTLEECERAAEILGRPA